MPTSGDSASRRPELDYRRLVEELPLVTYVSLLDDLLSPVYVSPRIESLLGYTVDEWLADPDLFWAVVHPEDHERVRRGMRRPSETGEHFRADYRLVARDGRVVWVHDESTVERDGDGQAARARGYLLDITERKLAEEELDRIFTLSPDPLVVLGFDGRIRRASPAYERLTGYSLEELRRLPLEERVHADDLPRVRAGFERLAAGGAMASFECRSRHRDGSYRWLLWSAAPFPDGSAMLGIGRDITERLLAEEAQQRTRALLDSIIENLPGALWVKDAKDLRYVQVSGAYTELLGRTLDDVYGRDDHDLFPPELAEVYRAADAEALATGRVHVPEETGRTAAGETVLLRTTKVPILGDDGRPLYVLGYAEDITAAKRAEEERRSAEQKLQRLVESIDEVFWIAAPDGSRVEYIGPAFERIWGLSSEDVTADPSLFFESVHPDDREIVAATQRRLLQEDFDVEFRIVRPDGETRWVRDRGYRVADEQGDLYQIAGIAKDVTAIKEAEDERERMEMELRVAQKLEAVGQLAAGIAHEMNTPIQFVGDSIDFLKDCFDDFVRLIAEYRAVADAAGAGAVDPDALERLRTLEGEVDIEYLQERLPAAFDRTFDGIQRVASIVKAMKAFAHPDQGTAAPADLNDALGNTLTIARNEYKYVADLETELGALPPVVCHLGDLNQVFLNLIVNAAHAIEATMGDSDSFVKGTITVRTERDGDEAVVRISDTGCGIPEEIRARVFDPFFTTKEVGKGTGQGLALARAVIVDKHGGTLGFESEPGQGTTFVIRLPVDGKDQTLEEAA